MQGEPAPARGGWAGKPPPHQSETLCLMLAGVRKGLRQPGEALQLRSPCGPEEAA